MFEKGPDRAESEYEQNLNYFQDFFVSFLKAAWGSRFVLYWVTMICENLCVKLLGQDVRK